MRVVLILATLVAVATSTPVSKYLEGVEFFDPFQDIQTFTPDEDHERALRATSSDIIYYFFSKSNPDHSFVVRTTSAASLAQSAFDKQKDTLFVIHGWKNSNKSFINTEIRRDILERHDVNVFIVDWSVLAGKNYITAEDSVSRVGQYVGEFVAALQRLHGLDLDKLRIVGHSLGAHVSGNAGRALGGRVKEITGLDPAGPLFNFVNKDNRLNADDARYVQVIHSNMGELGFDGSIGDSDYYPNGGRVQPGCGWDVTGSCSHGRSYELYAESLNSDRFLARKCSNYSEYSKGRCDSAPAARMGRFEVDTSARGKYFLNTNEVSPYAKG